jgi:3-phosphoshikimate 1-carboxyvinyltransferase
MTADEGGERGGAGRDERDALDRADDGLLRVRVPGDKSVSHRALLFAALAEGESRLEGVLPGADCQSTAAALRAMGVDVPDLPADGAPFTVRGVGASGLRAPDAPLNCGNSGTTARLLLGVLAGAGVPATLTGDASLLSRPMRRVTGPLEAMGARFREEGVLDRLPIRVLGEGEFRGGRWVLPVASAQVKSAMLLAGLLSGRPMEVEEPGLSRDHTERMLRAMGVPVRTARAGSGRAHRWTASIGPGPHPLAPLSLRVPGDPSSAAFLVALAAMGGAGKGLRIEGVGLNPTRTGFLDVFRRMGVDVEVIPDDGPTAGGADGVGEPTGTLVVRPSRLRATEVGGGEIPSLIDELPLVAVLAARARGTTRVRDAAELRVKESDRIAVTAQNLRALGVTVREFPDGMDVEGTQAPLAGRAPAHHDHRIAMAFGILGATPGSRVEVDDPAVVEVSFPGFWERLRNCAPRRPVVTLDGPAGSGKSTTAREVAARLGYLHLDSGALYRAVTLALLEADHSGRGRPEPEWSELTVEELEAFDIALERGPDGFRVRVGDRYPEAELRTPEVTERVSAVARIPAVRTWLLGAQRATAREGGVVTDGRDMGTVVFPDAEVKFFLVADLEERARRRLAETPDGGELGAEADRLARRDREDAGRAVAPLRRAPDAEELDTTHLTFEEQVSQVVERVRGREDSHRGP